MTLRRQRVALVADSSISLPRALAERWGVLVAPLELHFGDRVYKDGVELEPTAFYEMQRSADPLPTTSAPSPASFLEAFRKASATGETILCLTLSESLSMVYTSARLAMDMAKEALPGVAIRLLDTGSAAGAEALVVLAGAKAARGGANTEQVVEACQRVMAKVNLLALVDTLYYLWKGGRVPKVASWLGSVLQVKPILELSRGEVHLVGRPRTRARAMARLVAILDQRAGGLPIVVNVFHAADPEGATLLYQEVTGRFQCQDSFISEFSPAIGVHTGPGLLGLAFHTVE